jgi:GNAT superfamily N-acetyltransferase
MQSHDCETIGEIAQDGMTDDVLDGTIYPLAAATGHVAMLMFGEGVTLGRKVVVQQLDLANEATLDAILTDIQAAAAEGIIAGRTRYKGKHPDRWLELIYPRCYRPAFLGAFFPDGTLLGWVSMLRTKPDSVQLGSIIRPPYRNHGLGSALVLHAWRYAAEIYGDPAITGIAFVTRETNAPVLAIAKKHHLALVQTLVDASDRTAVPYVVFKAAPAQA